MTNAMGANYILGACVVLQFCRVYPESKERGLWGGDFINVTTIQ
jgi:hypothetical protein